ncbi:hypothetical protein Q7P37_006363 [Cladosporium fusiforme]
MASEVHEDSSTDVPDDSSTDEEADGNDRSHAAEPMASRGILKRPANLPAFSPSAKHQKLLDAKPKSADAGKSNENPLDFLRSRPQIATMNAAQEAGQTVETATPKPPVAKEANDLVLNTAFEGQSAAWQHNETVLEFLRRLPVDEPATARVGPWLWVGSKMIKQHWKRSKPAERLSTFMAETEPLLDGLMQQRATIEQQNPGKALGTITRKMGPYRDQLQIDLLKNATRTGVTSGKWMLFPKPDDLHRVWRQVAEATADGKLGPTSKVGTYEPDNLIKGTLICVYTYDFSELADVKRVLHALFDLNIVKGGTRFYYNLYSSEEVLNDKVKYTDGVILRLQKRNGAMEEFLNS